MNKNDLWIGDWLYILSTNKRGTFEGLDDAGRLKIKVGDEIFTENIENVELSEDQLQGENNIICTIH